MSIKAKIVLASVISVIALYGCDGTNNDSNAAVSGIADNETDATVNSGADTDTETAVSDDGPENKSESDSSTENSETAAPVDTQSADTSPSDESSSEREETSDNSPLYSALLAETGSSEDSIAVFHEEDFDGDGTKEAFALIGQKVDDYGDCSVIEGEIWFASTDGCVKLHDTAGMGYSDVEQTMTMGDTTYILFDEIYVTDMLTDVWYVEDGKALQPPFTARGQILTGLDKEDNRFRIVHSSYDCNLDPEIGMIGHSWKQYYFFYDPETQSVCEYAGTTIDEATAEMWCGHDIVKELLPAGANLDSLFCRGNGLIVMNYSVINNEYTDFYHYIYDFTNETLVDDSRDKTDTEPLPGICMPALCPEIASYPQVPGPGDMVWYGE